MSLENEEKLEQADIIINGMRILCQLLECPNVPPITSDVLIVFECAFERTMQLINEVLKTEISMTENTRGEV